MAYPLHMNFSGASFAYDSNIDPQLYGRDDFPMELNDFWTPNLLGSSLRNTTAVGLYHGWNDSAQPQQQSQRLLIQPEKVQYTVSPFHALQAQAYHMDFNRPYEAPGSLPDTCELSTGSPSICSSARSPRTAEDDWALDGLYQQNFHGCSLSRSISHASQNLPDPVWPPRTQSQGRVPGHINLSEVQGFPDPQEVTFQDDEGYTKMEIACDVDTQSIKEERYQRRYRHSSDEGIGQSLQDEASPAPKNIKPVINSEDDAEADAEGEYVEETEEDPADADAPMHADEDEDTDTEYTPKGRRSSKRRRTARASPVFPTNKRPRVAKNTKAAQATNSKSQHQCKQCKHTAKDSTTLGRHVAAAHTRPFICTFAFAGCKSTLGNKNEWKRHVASQHLRLQHWVCSVGNCGATKVGASKVVNSNEFNRKDLFTQHLRRMHAPFTVKNKQKSSPEWEEQVKRLQTECLQVRREAPSKTKCPIRACGAVFEGTSSWDDRMEHVGRHLEKVTTAASAGEDAGVHDVIEQESDEFMIDWALREGVIELRGDGKYVLLASGGRGVTSAAEYDGDGDAEGEYE